MNSHRIEECETYYESPDDISIQPGAIVGFKYAENCPAASFKNNCVVRSGTIVYGGVEAGRNLQTGHNALIREHTRMGDHVLVGTNTVIDGYVTIGNFVKIESNCYICTHTVIGNRVFFGPGVVLTNDRYPLKMRDAYKPEGPVIHDGVTLGGGVVVLPGVEIGAGSFVAAGAVVTRDVPPMSLVVGSPGTRRPLPEKLKEENMALSWRPYFDG